MKAKFIFRNDSQILFECFDNYNFEKDEEFEINSLKITYIDELRSLFWVLLSWIVAKDLHLHLTQWFPIRENRRLAIEKLYTVIRFECGWVTQSYDRDGKPLYIARSTAKGKISQNQFSDLYDKTFEYFSERFDLSEFCKEYQFIRENRRKI